MVTGIIAEFNMFHNGHKYIVDCAKDTGDAVVAVMSGSFVQRGDVAIYDKWTRAKTALLGGVDLVLGLPECYALGAAPNFALGGVGTLDALGITDKLIFGSEEGDIEALKRAAQTLNDDLKADKVRKYLSQGLSYPAAVTRVYEKDINPSLLTSPNNILAVEYIRAIDKLNAKITPVTVKRYMTDHDAKTADGSFAPAAMLREMAIRGESIREYVPYDTAKMPHPRSLSVLNTAIISRLRTMVKEDITSISEVTEGLENRIIKAARDCENIEDLISGIKSKRYTMSKIRRIVINTLIGNSKDTFKPIPDYIRVLGMNKRGAQLLKEAKKKCSLPIITKAADYTGKSAQFDLDVRATDISALCDRDNKKGGGDFTRSPIVIK